MLSYVRIRDSVFASAGYNPNVSEAVPNGFKDRNVFFVTTDTRGIPTSTGRVAGCQGQGEDEYFVRLRPYRGDPEKAPVAVEAMCVALPLVLAGQRPAQKALGELLQWLVLSEIQYADEKMQIGLLCALYGTARVHDELNRRASLIGLKDLDMEEMIAEAFGR